MAENVSDEVLAQALQQAGILSFDQLEAARREQTEQARIGPPVNLADMLLRQGVITPAILENFQKRIQARQAGGLKELGPYRLIRKLGEGGMGQVYLAEDTHAGRTVAIKILLKKFADDHEFLTRFRREAQATGKLNHANIVCAYTVGEEQGVHYYAMEYCDGEGLNQILKRVPSIPWKIAAGVILQVARGLEHAHAQGIIHRDIKPENILISRPPGSVRPGPTADPLALFAEGYVAKILDLGLSKDVGGASSSFYTQTGVAMGTPHYISPEQAKGESHIDGRADIYSLGATFYHLVTGATPFTGSTAAIVMMKHVSDKLPDPQDVSAQVPDGVVHIIRKMMAKAPADRYASCKQLLADLELVLDGQEPSSAALDVAKSSVAMARTARPRKAGVAAPGQRRSTGPVQPVGAPLRQTLATRGRGQEADAAGGSAEIGRYLVIGAALLGALILVLALSMGGNRDGEGRKDRLAAEKRKAEEAARLEEERRRVAEEKRKADESRLEAEKARLAEERRKEEEARLAAEENAVKKLDTATTKLEPPVRPDLKPVPLDTKAGELPVAPADGSTKVRQALEGVWKETVPLLAQNRFADALAILERKAKDPALADAAERLKQEKTDLESVVELRRLAVEALRKMAGQEVTLKKASGAIKGKVVDDPKPGVVTVNVGGPEISLRAEQVHVDDIAQYAPSTGDAGEDLRRRGLLYFYLGDIAKAKEYFANSQTRNPEAYVERIGALEAAATEAAAAAAWERAEKFFAAKDLKAAKTAYASFEREFAKTRTLAELAARLKERYAAIDPAPKVVGVLRDKTLVAWAAPANLTQRGGSVLTLEDAHDHFDAIVFAEAAPAKWMAGSDFFLRTQRDQTSYPTETAVATTFVQIAIVYKEKQIAIYRNGQPCGQYAMAGPPMEFGAQSMVLIGKRHLHAGGLAYFAGAIDDVRIYHQALSAEQLAALKPNEPSDLTPWAWWSFDDKEAKERTGRFPVTRLSGGAVVEGGKLVLDGKGAMMLSKLEVEAPGR